MSDHEVFQQPSWVAVENWLISEERKANESDRPYGYGNLNKYNKTPGAYAIYFPDTKQVYFGSTSHLYRRRIKHISDLRAGTHRSKSVQLAFYESGIDSIMFFYKVTETTNDAIELEQKFVDDYWGNPCLLNFGRNVTKPNLGNKYDEERLQKMRGLTYSEERLKLMSEITLMMHAARPNLRKEASERSLLQWSEESSKQIMIEKALPNLKLGVEATSKAVTIDGINYPSIAEAGRAFKVSPCSITHKIKSNRYPGWTMSDKLTQLKEPLKELETTLKPKSIIFYCDGGCRGGNPGNIGWGVHGYVFDNEVPKRGSGNTTHILTASGYVPKSAKLKDGFVEVRPIQYYDFFGSSLEAATNNVAELEAARNALTKAKEFDVSSITVYTDSEYVRRGVEEWSSGWVKRNWIRADGLPVPNAEHWKQLLEVINDLKALGISVKINWVKGHNEILGNVLADKLATVGVMYSSDKVLRNEFKVSEPEGYWKQTNERHPFVVNKCMYFNTTFESQIQGEYYLGDHGTDDELLGTKTNNGAFAVVQLAKPESIIESVRKYQTDISNNFDSIIILRLDKLYTVDTYQDVTEYGSSALVRANPYSLNLNCLDGKPLSKELRPARIAMRAIEALMSLKELLIKFQMVENNTGLLSEEGFNFRQQDITHLFYEEEIKLKKKVEEVSLKLKSSFCVGFSSLPVVADVLKDNKEININLALTLGTDLPDRNSLKRLETMNPKIHLITWKDGPNSVRYAVIIKSEESYGIWAGVYSNMVFI